MGKKEEWENHLIKESSKSWEIIGIVIVGKMGKISKTSNIYWNKKHYSKTPVILNWREHYIYKVSFVRL